MEEKEFTKKVNLLTEENKKIILDLAKIIQEKNRLCVENNIMKRIIKENELGEALLNDKEFIEYLKSDL